MHPSRVRAIAAAAATAGLLLAGALLAGLGEWICWTATALSCQSMKFCPTSSQVQVRSWAQGTWSKGGSNQQSRFQHLAYQPNSHKYQQRTLCSERSKGVSRVICAFLLIRPRVLGLDFCGALGWQLCVAGCLCARRSMDVAADCIRESCAVRRPETSCQ